MKDSEIREVKELCEIQSLLYNLLAAFHKVCEDNGLYYVVFGGTMLGAVRHQAMIPWDDDVDVCMPRDDYEKLCRIVNDSEQYVIKNYPQDGYAYDYAKFCMKDSCLVETEMRKKLSMLKLYIDVFPVDGYPPQEEEKEHFRKLKAYNNARSNAVKKAVPSKTWWKKPYAVVKFIKYLPYRLIGYKYFTGKAVEERQRYDLKTSQYVAMQGAGWNERGKLEKEILYQRKLYAFGPIQVWGIADYHKHLTRLYGDYMTPPPVDKRTSNHTYKLYIKKEQNYER